MTVRSSRRWGFFLLLCLAGTELYAATLEGFVTLEEPPRQRRRQSRAYTSAEVDAMGPAPARIGAVYLKGEHLPPLAAEPPVAEVAQRDIQFYPWVLPVQVGGTVFFPNFDSTHHNVFSYSQTKSFDLGRYLAGSAPPSLVFEKEGEVDLFCEVHEHMRSTIWVVPSPLYTTTDPEGKFVLEGVPPGDYELIVWHFPGRIESIPLTVPADTPVVRLDLRHDR